MIRSGVYPYMMTAYYFNFRRGAGWLTVLKKHAGYRKAFDNFDVQKVADYSELKSALQVLRCYYEKKRSAGCFRYRNNGVKS